MPLEIARTHGPLVSDERALLREVLAALRPFGDAGDERRLQQALDQLDELFLLVVVGEYNAGKSAFINALVGRPVLEEGVTPTTSDITVLQHGPDERSEAVGPRLRAVFAPVDLLRDIHIVDTPGTNAVIREHEALTADFVPRADLVLFVTSADRPFTESERQFLSQIGQWGKKTLFVINKVDILGGEADVAKVREFVAGQAERLIGMRPPVFAVSARAALRAKQGEAVPGGAGGFGPLEEYVRTKLDETARLKLKLLNPLGVARHLVERYLDTVGARLDLLAGDVRALDDVDRQMAEYERDMIRDVNLRFAEIDRDLLAMEQRGHAFFDEMIRLGRVVDLLNRARVQQGFEEQVVADTPATIERRVNDLIDWLVDADFRQWQAVTAYLAERRRAHRDRLVGDVESAGFHAERGRLLEGMGRNVQDVVETYDRAAEARALAEGARHAVAAAAAAGAGAVGLGTAVTLVASTAAADVTGLVMAGLLATLGFFVIPARRRRAKREMQRKVTVMREQLAAALRGQFDLELRRALTRIRDGFAPYARFIRAEGEKLEQRRLILTRLQTEMDRVRARVEAIG